MFLQVYLRLRVSVFMSTKLNGVFKRKQNGFHFPPFISVSFPPNFLFKPFPFCQVELRDFIRYFCVTEYTFSVETIRASAIKYG